MKDIDFLSFENQLVELYTKDISEFEEAGSFSLGYIAKDLEEFILFLSISEYGILESIQIRRKDYIENIVSKSEYINMYNFFVKYARANNIFDPYSLLSSRIINKSSLKSILDTVVTLNRTVSIITSTDENIITGKVIILDTNRMAISLLNHEMSRMSEKITVNLDNVICIDLVSVENLLYDKYLDSKND